MFSTASSLVLSAMIFPATATAHPVTHVLATDSRLRITLLTFLGLSILLSALVFCLEISFLSISTWLGKYLPAPARGNSQAMVRNLLIFSIPVAWTALFAVFIASVALIPTQIPPEACDSTSSMVDSDIVGFGVRVSVYGIGSLVTCIAVLGHFHAEPSGIEELGLFLLLSLATNLVNLVKAHWVGTNSVNILYGAANLEACISAMSIALAMKEFLARRWRVIGTVFLQGLSLVAVAVSIAIFSRNHLQEANVPACDCFEISWWGYVSTCAGASMGFWMYFVLRTQYWVHESWLALKYSSRYAAAKRIRDGDGDSSKLSKHLIQACVFDTIPATAMSSYSPSLFALICTCVSIEVSLKSHGSQDDYLAKTWGQSAQLISLAWCWYRWSQQLAAMFTVEAARRRQASVALCSIGTRIPSLAFLEDIDKKEARWNIILMRIRRTYRNHPFGPLPPRRRSDHTRFCEEVHAWKRIQLDFRQWSNTTDDEKGQLLLDAAKLGDLNLVSDLLQELTPIDFVNLDRHTALRIAVDYNHVSVVSKLLEQGADPNISDTAKRTPLHVAAERGDEEITRALLRAGASASMKEGAEDWKPLHVSARYGQASVMIALLSNGADADAKDRKGRTAMHILVRYGQEGLVSLLVKNCDPNVADGKGKTALYLAARYERVEAARILLKHGVELDAPDLKQGWTPLHITARYSRPKVAKLLLEHGCSCSIKDKEASKTALHIAVNYGREEVVDHLLQFDADVDELDYKNRTALFFAAKDDRDATRKLLRKGASPSIGNISFLKDLLQKYGATEEEASSVIQEGNNSEILNILSKSRD